jgi:hypothetical protein
MPAPLYQISGSFSGFAATTRHPRSGIIATMNERGETKMSQAETGTRARLTPRDAELFAEQGFLLYDQPVFAADHFKALQDHFEVMLDRWLQDPRMRSPEHMDAPHFFSPRLFDWLLHDDVLDLVEPLIGRDIALFASHFICKPPSVGKRVPWHEDSAIWKDRLVPMRVVTVWLAIDPSTPANGCMRVIPGTHDHGYSDYEDVEGAVFAREIKPSQMSDETAVDCILRPNEASLHDGRLIHGSSANTGSMRRCGFTMRYIPTTTKMVESEKNQDYPLYLARGRDRAGNRYGDPSKPNQAWIDAHKDGFPIGH